MVAFVTIIEAVIKSEGPRKRTIFGKIQFIRLIEMFIEIWGAPTGFHRAVKETSTAERIEKCRSPQISGCFINTIRKA